jgi:hypothetical protein
MLTGTKQRNTCSRAALPLQTLLVSAMALASTQAFAQDTTEAATQGLSCEGQRHGSTVGCVANDFVVTAALNSNTITSCQVNTQVVIDILVGLNSGNATRYDIGLFIGENGNSPQTFSLTDTCSVTTFPSTPPPWFGPGSNSCGDYQPNGSTSNLVTGVKVLCAADANGNLLLPYTLVYDNNANSACTGATDVQASTQSKCQSGGLAVTNVTVLFSGDPTCTKDVVYDPVAQTVSMTIHISNVATTPPDPADNTTFDDVVPGPVVVTGAVCQNPLGGASCPASVTVSGNEVSGNVPLLPAGGSVDIVISGTVPPGSGSAGPYSNTANLTPAANVTDPNLTNNSCTNGALPLPVKLQSFEVH